MRARLLPVALAAVGLLGQACTDLPSVRPLCEELDAMVLMAQSTPSAQEVACMQQMPFGFRATTFDVGSDESTWHLSHDVVGLDVVRVRLDEECESFLPDRDLLTVPDGAEGWTEFVVEDGSEAYLADWARRRGGACVVVTLDIQDPNWPKVLDDLRPSLDVVDRDVIAQRLHEESDGRLRLVEHRDVSLDEE